MAEFKLGRIKFVWKGVWATNTNYVVDDVVNNGGKTYICVISHTASPLFATDFDAIPSKWNLVSDGTAWTGSWAPNTYYNQGDQVLYGATVYVCNTPHTSATYMSPTYLGLENDQSKWDVFAASFFWAGAWTTSTRYRVKDLVTYGGVTYVCNTAHISASTATAGLETDQSKWDVFNSGITYTGDWSGSSVRYKLNDVVKYGPDLWICTTYHTSSASFDATKWAVFVNGLDFESSWNSSTLYQIGDTVTYGGYSYIAKTNNTNSIPTSSPTDWDVFTTGFSYQGPWNNSTNYQVGQVVRLGGYTYLAIADNTNQTPPNGTYWAQLNSGLKWNPTAGSYTGIAATNVSSFGSNATFNVTRSGTVYTVTVNNAGTGYVVGDTLKILGTAVGGLSPANDINITVAGVTSSAITTITTSGISVTWSSGITYVLGDVVMWGASSYICVNAHIAANGNRPDADTSATYWNLLASGSEQAVLSVTGDTFYYGATGPTRLPIGADGQILRVSSGLPTWAYYGAINNVVYVSNTTGTDAASYGLTIDRPFKTIRYACKQVEDGYLNPNATALLAKNKQFIMKEISNWVTYTYSVSISAAVAATGAFTCNSTANLIANMPIQFTGTIGGVTAGTKYYVKTIIDSTHFTISTTSGGIQLGLTDGTGTMTGSLAYNYTYCERDVGIIVDALIFDIGHGGSAQTTAAALAYYTSAGTSFITSNFGTQTTQTVAAYNYLASLVNTVLSNTMPAFNYQRLNNQTTVASQIIDTSLTTESTVPASVSYLVSIITNGISAGVSSAIPTAIQPNTTIYIKTGTYNEVLPIVVPRNTAVVGDELRGTVVQPLTADALLSNDKTKSISALNRLKALVPSIVGNVNATVSTGNTSTQQHIYGDVDSVVSTSFNANVNTMFTILKNGLSAVPSATIVDPSQYDTGYYNARRLIVANKSFLQAEVAAYMAANYASVWSGLGTNGQNNCTRDIGYIVDALQYDLTYQGNLETIVVARSYYSNGTFVENSNEKTAAIAVQNRLIAIISSIAQGITITKTSGNSSTQDTSGTGGSFAAGSFAISRVTEIRDTINTGTTPTLVAPDTSWVPATLTAANATLQAAKTSFQAQVLAWINANYPSMTYTQATCSRDVGYILDALCYDMMFGGNFRSIKAAMSYYRALASTQVVVNTELNATIGAIYYLSKLAKTATYGTGSIVSNLNTMTNILKNGLTAVPSYVIPDPVGYDSGYYNARRLIVANKQFLKDEVTAYMVQNYGSLWTSLGTSGQAACTRDIGYIVDALQYDLTYQGNLATVIAARSYYSNGTFVEASGEKTAALAVQTRLNAIISNIAQGVAITRTTGNTTSQVVSGTAGSSAAGTFAAARITEVYNTINTGTAPATIAPSTSWVASSLATAGSSVIAQTTSIQNNAIAWVNIVYPTLQYNNATCSRDVGYIVNALAYDMMFGSNFLSCWNAMSYYRALTSTGVVLTNQLQPTLGVISLSGASVKELVAGNTGTVGDLTVISKVRASTDLMYDIVNNGLSNVPAFVLPQPTGYNSTYLVGYGDGLAQIVQNYQFIKDEISAYLNVNYNSVWTAIAQASCTRDIGYILDAMQYDMTYGGNTQSLIVGSAYFSNYVSTIAASEKTAIIAAYGRLKTIIGQIAQKQTVTPTAGNVTAQVTTGTAGSAGSATFAQARVQDIVDWINNGTANATIAPSITWTQQSLQNSFAALQAKRSEIQSDTVVWVKKFYQGLNFNTALCSRDAGLIVDAISYDMVFGSNFNSIQVGRSYYRNVSSITTVMTSQKSAELGAINFIKHKARAIAVAGTVAQVTQAIDDINRTITGGGVPRFLWPDYTGINANSAAAAKLIYNNSAFIQAEVWQYLATNYPSLSYSVTTCLRDVNYLVEAIRYDLTYGGNKAVKIAGKAYYSALTNAFEIASSEKAATLAAYALVKTIAQAIAQGGAYSALQTNVSRVTGTSGNAGTSTTVGALLDVFTNIINNGLTSGVPTITITTIASGTTFTTGSAHGLSVGDEVTPQSTANGLVSGTTYYVASTPLTTTFTLAATWGGAAITTFTNGTSLSIVAETANMAGFSWVDTGLTTQQIALSSAKATIQTNVINYITTNYPTLSYNQATCSRDVGMIIDAIGYDFMMGSNYRSIKAGMSYYRAQAALVVGSQKAATIAAFNYLKTQIATTLVNSATAVASANANMDTIIAILTNGANAVVPEVHGSVSYNNVLGAIFATELLRANKDFLANEATAYIASTYGATVTATAAATGIVTTSSAHNLSIGDPVNVTATKVTTRATATNATGNLITLGSTSGLVSGMPISFTGTGFGNLVSGTTYFVLNVVDSYNITVSATSGGAAFTVTTASGALSVTAGGVFGGLTDVVTSTGATQVYYVLSVPSTTTLTLTATQGGSTPVTLTDATGVATITYYFSRTSCARDARSYVDALIYDVNYTGNYKSLRAAKLYNNAVGGSVTENMFLVRNGTGVRNMTLSGLTGTLTNANSFGTKRPTAGAYVSLDPGFGPNDTNVWITTRSCYSQNVTMFGTGCVGGKIDGALHAGGNRSTVANDFTTILSDGIGVWCTGSGSLTELVSVFNYYGYAGYLAELGGRIRATNGNSSYGTYGVIAEGVDSYEVPLYATMNNRFNQAQIGNTVTDLTNNILRLEFTNAGSNYTNTVHTINGSGYNAAATADEFRDRAIFESRLVDLNDGNGYGGAGYVTFANAAQSGDTTSITIAATDTSLSNAYNGMRVQITAGTGVGQYANIYSYNNGSKVAQVVRDTFTTQYITTTTTSTNLITVGSTAQMYVGMKVFVASNVDNLTAGTVYYVISSGFSSTQFKLSTTLNGSAVSLSGTTGQNVALYAAGWDHIVPGSTLVNTLDLTTTYIIEPRINYTAPGYTATARTMSASAAWNSVTYAAGNYVATPSTGTATSYSTDGVTWSSAGALPTSASWTDVVYGGGEGATASVVVGGLGGAGAVLTAVLGSGVTANQVVSVNIVSGGYGYTTAPTIVFTPVSGGSGATATCTVLNGAITSVTMSITGSGYTVAPTVTAATDRLTNVTVNSWGKNYFNTPTVTVSTPGGVSTVAWSANTPVTNGTYLITTDSNIYLVTSSGTTSTTKPSFTSGSGPDGTATLSYYGQQAVLTPTLTNNGVSALTFTKYGAGYTTTPTVTILDTNAKYVTIANGANNSAYQTVANLGSAWTAGGSTSKTTLTSLAYGNGVYVAVGGTTDAVSSTDGSTWISRTMQSTTGTWASVAYGNGVFVAISSGDVATAYSTNGVTWVAGGNLPSSTTWTSIAYGNGRFVAIASGGTVTAYSLDKGVTWTSFSVGLPSSQSWSRIRYGQGLFMAISTGGSVCATSPYGINWTQQAMPSSSNWKALAFGNPSKLPRWVAISNTTGTTAASIRTGAQATGRMKVASGVLSEIRMIEPGSGYPMGTVTATTSGTNLITADTTTNLIDSQPIEFTGVTSGGLAINTTYYVIGSSITSTQFSVSATAGSSTPVTLSTTTGLSGTYRAGPIVTQYDPNKVKTAAIRVRQGDGALGNPSFSNRGTNNTTATTTTSGDGYSDLYQPSNFINVAGLYAVPTAGANVEFASIPNTWFKLVTVTNVLGVPGNYTAQFQINPSLTVYQAPAHGTLITTRLKYSQVRLTGHDFLYIGTGNFTRTNYPNVDPTLAIQANQELYSGGGRVFFTSTDQDGNFNVGNLFGVQQATGTATLNASAFNLAGLQSLQLGAVSLGVGSAIITQFSTDPYFTANSDNIVPTQKAIKAYITAQIGGGSSSLNVNTLTAGQIYIANNTISNTAGTQILITSKMNFVGGIDGAPVALGFFMQR